ncbi:MAG: phosphatidylserine decarboxylase [Bacteroidales bacterium]|nr:phosphatidylserine decarboxylase [Bacteroidales bacterium]
MYRQLRHTLLLAVISLTAFCGCGKTGGRSHTAAVEELVEICNGNSEVRSLLEHAIKQAAQINPDRKYNPAQTLDEFYDFIDWNIRSLPWDVMTGLTADKASLYSRLDQGVGYFWFVVDQPLEELEGRGYYYPTVEFVSPFSDWLTKYASSWGSWLSTPESWTSEYAAAVSADPDWGISKGWYEDASNWKTFNDFFARRLSSPAARPLADADVLSPADSYPQGLWEIGSDNRLVHPENIDMKTARLSSVSELIGEGSAYGEAFAGGTFTHTFLDVNDYHRYHSPVEGTVLEVRNIPGVAAGGGYTLWDNGNKRYYYINETGFQMVETRSCAIIQTEEFGLVAILPVGMSQICSCNWLPSIKEGCTIRKGEEMGYFLFGGSDIILLFQKGVEVIPAWQADADGHILQGSAYANLKKRD